MSKDQMIRINTAQLTPYALDWMVAKGRNPEWWDNFPGEMDGENAMTLDDGSIYSPSIEWADAGPIIHDEGIDIRLRCDKRGDSPDVWDALIKPEFYSSGRKGSGVKKELMMTGDTPLEAAMRCYVASRFGQEVEIPAELVWLSQSSQEQDTLGLDHPGEMACS